MNMRKKEILATLVMLTLMQGSVYAENWSHEYIADKDTEWGYVLHAGLHPNSHLEKRVAEQCMLEIN